MKYRTFRAHVAQYPYFRSHILEQLTPNVQLLRNQLVDWVKKGYVYELKRGIYTLNEQDRDVGLTPEAVAYVLYFPSYISLEYALSFYQLIPEKVELITSVTTKKTQQFSNALGHFLYRHVAIKSFQGFVEHFDEFSNRYFIALPEKALVDTLYFQLPRIQNVNLDWFEQSLRLQNVENLNLKKIQTYANLFQQKKLLKAIHLLESYYD